MEDNDDVAVGNGAPEDTEDVDQTMFLLGLTNEAASAGGSLESID